MDYKSMLLSMMSVDPRYGIFINKELNFVNKSPAKRDIICTAPASNKEALMMEVYTSFTQKTTSLLNSFTKKYNNSLFCAENDLSISFVPPYPLRNSLCSLSKTLVVYGLGSTSIKPSSNHSKCIPQVDTPVDNFGQGG